MELTFKFKCHVCNSLVNTAIGITDYFSNLTFIVAPCRECLDNSRNKGYKEGHAEGYEEGNTKSSSNNHANEEKAE